MRSIAPAVLIVALVLPRAAFAQAPSNPIRHAITQETVRVAANRDQAPPAAQSGARHRHWAARHPVLVGTIAGAGIGMAVLAAKGCRSSSDYTCTGLTLFAAGTGAGLGAAAGVVVGIALR